MKKEDKNQLSHSISSNSIRLNSKVERSGITTYFKSLWSWKSEPPQQNTSTTHDTITERDFSGYISDVAEGIDKLKKTVNRSQKQRQKQSELRSVDESIENIPKCYFQQNPGLQLGKLSSKVQARREQQRMNEYLDVVEVCLFRQINVRFADFFRMLENIQYLEKSVHVNIQILKQARLSISKIKQICADRVISVKKIKTGIQSRKQVLQLLNLLRQVRASGETSGCDAANSNQIGEAFQSIRNLKSIGHAAKQLSETRAGTHISKAIFDRVVNYLAVPLETDLSEKMRDIPCQNPSDGEEFINNTILLGQSRLDGFSLPIPISDATAEKQIGRMLGQAYVSINTNQIVLGWKHFTEKIEKKFVQFKPQINKVLVQSLKMSVHKDKKQILTELKSTNEQQKIEEKLPEKEMSVDNHSKLELNADKVSMAYFSKLVQTYNQCIYAVLARLVGIVGEFMQELYKLGVDEPPLFAQMVKFVQSLVNIINEKMFTLMALKKLPSDCDLVEFHSFIGQILFWEDHLKLILEKKLFSIDYCHASDSIDQQKSQLISNLQHLRSVKSHLQSNFIDKIHKIIVNEELRQALQDEPWVAIHNIPFNYMPVIYYILHGDPKDQNWHPNDSIMNERSRREMSILGQNKKRVDVVSYKGVDFKLLKNAIIVSKKHYRVNVCFLMFVEILQEYLKIQDLYPELKDQVMTKINQVVEVYNDVSYEMVVRGGALKLDKIKAKIITARHLCLSWSCLQLILVFLSPITHDSIGKTREILQKHSAQIVKRLSGLIKGKINHELANLANSNIWQEHPCPMPQTVSIVSAYKQMFEILQDHMAGGTVREVMQETVELLINAYAEYARSGNERSVQQVKFFIADMKVLEYGFKSEYTKLQQQIV